MGITIENGLAAFLWGMFGQHCHAYQCKYNTSTDDLLHYKISSPSRIEGKDNRHSPYVCWLIHECIEFGANVLAAISLTATTLIIGSADTS
jgi:hypothetical protein